jgi:L-fuconolactonase
MRIDAHQHFWIYDPREYDWIDDSMAALRRDFLPDALQPRLERAGFQGCVAVQARRTIEGRDGSSNWPRRRRLFWAVGWVDLQSGTCISYEFLPIIPNWLGFAT